MKKKKLNSDNLHAIQNALIEEEAKARDGGKQQNKQG